MADYYESLESIKNEDYAGQLTQAAPSICRYVTQVSSLKAALIKLVEINTDDTPDVTEQLIDCERILHMAKNQLNVYFKKPALELEHLKDLSLEFERTQKLFTKLSTQLEALTTNLVNHHVLHVRT